VGTGEDEIGQRHHQLHQALSRRCQELRAAVAPAAAPALPLPPAAGLSGLPQ
jgi:hypothetical protein